MNKRASFDKYGQVHHNETAVTNFVAATAAEMVNRWGMVAAEPAGEDSAGRAKLRLATPAELVDRAVRVAELLFDELVKRGHVYMIYREQEND